MVSTIQNKGRPAEILLVEDNYGDALLTRKAFKTAKIISNITIAIDGEQALAMLRRVPPYTMAPIPDVILLDLNLPKKNGHEVLQEIKSNERLKRIPVIILTSSLAEKDVVKSYELHANCYIVKPVDPQEFIEIAKMIERFWFNIVVLPDNEKIVDSRNTDLALG
jgi:chemotaxis family two-component system response regulator Rcp1